MGRNMSREPPPHRDRQPDLQFDCGVGFFENDEALAAQRKIIDQCARQRVDRGDFQDRQLMREAEGMQQIVQIGVADACRNDAQRRALRFRSRREEGAIALPALEFFFNRRQFLVQLLVQCHSGARRRRPAPGVFFEIGASKRRIHRIAFDRLFGVTDAHRGS